MKDNYHTLRFILGDQLNANHSWLKEKDENTLYVIAEMHSETNYVKHHVQKICAFFAAMAQFAGALKEAGHHVLYLTLDDTIEFQSPSSLIKSLYQRYNFKEIHYQRPDEYRLLKEFEALTDLTVKLTCYDSEHFLFPFEEISNEFPKSKHILMEHFYRRMRKRFDILMTDKKPEGGKWNYDANNRNKLKKADLADIPQPIVFAHDISAILERVNRHQVIYFGHIDTSLFWPITRQESLQVLNYFVTYLLPKFGTFQDAMTCQSEHAWSLYHSRLSFALNTKMIHPLQVINAALEAYRNNDKIDISQVEGFIRQILGWREYIRAIYWANMPDYASYNALSATRALPDFFWHGKTKMNCLSQTISQSLDYAYAHHIQRLMVTGNFSLIAELNPDEVDEWYLGIYIDALEWVEMPNTRGMALFADGGIIATKPYAASGNYISKMSDYCSSCHYNVKEKIGEKACPMNSLYWNFMIKHREQLSKNPRIGMLYRTWDKQNDEQQEAVLRRATWCLDNLNAL